jgi:DHA3 family macrolide efflux protein-like MFS transporter
VSQNISLFGSSVVGFAILWHVTIVTSSGAWIMLTTICSSLPQVLMSLFGGVLADRYNRKHLIMLADGFIALSTLVLAVAFLGGIRRLELLLAVSAVRSLGAGIQTPAVSAIYPQLVPSEKLTKVQGLNQTLNSISMLLSPAAGGMILSVTGIVGTLFVDVATAALAIAVMARISVKSIRQAHGSATVWQDIFYGISYTFRHMRLRRLIICSLFSFFLVTPAAVLTQLMVERTFGAEIWRLTANEIVWTIGSMIGGVFVSLKGHFQRKAQAIGLSLVGLGSMFGLLGVATNFMAYLAFMGIAGCFMPLLATAQTVYIQEITEPDVLGRVFSLVQLISSSAMPIAILFFGPLADIVRVEYILLVSGALLALTGITYCRVEKRAGVSS